MITGVVEQVDHHPAELRRGGHDLSAVVELADDGDGWLRYPFS
jgi:hypothetical protein